MRDGEWLYIPAQGTGGFTTEYVTKNMYLRWKELGFTNSDINPEGRVKPGAPPAQLYNLKTDPAETTNLYSSRPEIVKRMSGLLDRIKAENRSRPL